MYFNPDLKELDADLHKFFKTPNISVRLMRSARRDPSSKISELLSGSISDLLSLF